MGDPIAATVAPPTPPPVVTPPPPSGLNYSVQFTRASYGNPRRVYNTPDVLYAELGMLLSLNPNQVRIDIDFTPWLTRDTATIDLMDGVIARVKSSGAALVIADAGAEYYRSHLQSWGEFKAQWPARVQTLAQRYNPSAYIVIKEPAWYNGFLTFGSGSSSPMEWANLASTLNHAVKSVSSAQTGVSISAGQNDTSQKNILQACLSTSIDFIGFDIYGPVGYTETTSFLTQNGSAGKPVWSAEAWSSTNPFNIAAAQPDVTWIVAHRDFCNSINAAVMNPFYTDCFATYSPPLDAASLVALYQTSRTPVYWTYADIIQGSI